MPASKPVTVEPLTAQMVGVVLVKVTARPEVAVALAEYNGGYWQFYALSNGGFYMAPRNMAGDDTIFSVSCVNGFEGQMTADALGIVASLYSFSNLSFGDGAFAEACANHYHLLLEYMFGHPEVRAILRAID